MLKYFPVFHTSSLFIVRLLGCAAVLLGVSLFSATSVKAQAIIDEQLNLEDDAQLLQILQGDSSLTAVKTEDTIRYTGSPEEVDPHLSLALEANSYYSISGFLTVYGEGSNYLYLRLGGGKEEASGRDFSAKMSWFPDFRSSSTDAEGVAMYRGSRAFVFQGARATETDTFPIAAQMISIQGVISTGASARNWEISWRPGIISEFPVAIVEGSWIRAEKIDQPMPAQE